MIKNDLHRLSTVHDIHDNQPNISGFGSSTKKPQKELIADAITGAAAPVIKVLHTPDVKTSKQVLNLCPIEH